ncbi:unnamed protein product [Danaus chrysippus]|uniref:Fucosyltransferase n=1 Tax=Danaus chrysippus TaxID=151541 RepID=A0A8J2RDF8_9NEOP|nr:unnamed protein product [Danaus chrysippus]
MRSIETDEGSKKLELERRAGGLKYILQWTSPKNVPFVYMGVGRQGYIDRNCTYTNCFVTSDRSYLGGVEKFDVIAFAGPEVIRYSKGMLPNKRSPHQKYAFASIESSHYYPVCSDHLNDFFNWTWTFKTNSDSRWGYMAIRDEDNNLIGPNAIMHWKKLEDMKPVSSELKEKLKSKKKAASWFVSNCFSMSKREDFVKQLSKELEKYNLVVDIYGACGSLKCSTGEHEECLKMIERDYYFYLSFENSFCEDYVTEKLLHALQHNAVPVVFGAANYTRFMPDGIYLNARELGVQKLAEKMNELIKSPDKYVDYFRWQNHYSYHSRADSIETDDYCGFCTMLNNEELVKKESRYLDMKKWWNQPNRC